ncbi:hypothetical protein COEREDRAFT_89673 [Coemansia reversa NRRL 1564]|uniref:Uncharacterized protein n=1 Tax=Coemansia reversa (strain ATCC 12441 / NRRL 1564) TaxID=763665 RepID=A0A2G5B2S3_COERN|nr:hypothetical protein COEREDRAFT_89673 [Coemansia reversa NRRL 1564]|eukprot:PIA13322.1 hypothetical protein COEREDRAFT_89673 [Coemansia reversa NRRL 1564]
MFGNTQNIVFTENQRPSLVNKIQALKGANRVLKTQFVCLSRIREPLAHVGGYWNMDSNIIFKVTTGTLETAVNGLEQMRDILAKAHGNPDLDEEVNREIELFLEYSSIWIRTNRIDYSGLRFSLCENNSRVKSLSPLASPPPSSRSDYVKIL